jgi:Tfp pilus assembly protein PilF
MVEPRLVLASFVFDQDPKAAMHLLREAYHIQPDNLKTLLYIGLYYKSMEEPHEARKWFEKALEIDPENIEAKKLITELGQKAN